MPQIGAVADQSDPDESLAAEDARRPGFLMREHHEQDHADDREQRIKAGKRGFGIEQENRSGDHEKTEHRQEIVGAHAVLPNRKGRKRSCKQLPYAARRQVEIRRRVGSRKIFAEQKASEGRNSDHPENAVSPEAPREKQKDGEEHVILFFDGQAPCVEKRFFLDCRVEIVRLHPEEDARDKEACGNDALREVVQLAGQNERPCCGHAGQYYESEGRQDTPSAVFVKLDYAKTLSLNVGYQDCRDKVSADHEKYVDTNISPSKKIKPAVEQNYG